MPKIAKEFSLEPAMQGLILSAFFWSYALLQIPGGWLIDRFGPRALITGATVGWGFFQAIAGIASGNEIRRSVSNTEAPDIRAASAT